MFESTLNPHYAESRRPWAIVVSFLLQMLVILTAALLSLLSARTSPMQQWVSHLIAPPPRLGAPDAAQAAPAGREASRPAVFNRDEFATPFRIPDQVILSADIEAPEVGGANSISEIAGGPAGLGQPGGVPGGIPWALNDSAAPPPPPAPEPALAAVLPADPIRISGDLQQAKLIHKVMPAYPPLARRSGMSGVVRLEAIINREGYISELRVTGGHPLFVRAALDAVKQWRYAPTRLNGVAVEVITQIEVRFVLR